MGGVLGLRVKRRGLVSTEFGRIPQSRLATCHQVLVLRLVEYKSYIPMGVFERRRLYEQTDGSEDGHTTDQGEAAEVRRVSAGVSAVFARCYVGGGRGSKMAKVTA